MADTGRRDVNMCDTTCGCPYPCPGGASCRCTGKSRTTESATGGADHSGCSCGEHCSCNPCSCSKTEVLGTGKAYCKCGSGCACPTCAA